MAFLSPDQNYVLFFRISAGQWCLLGRQFPPPGSFTMTTMSKGWRDGGDRLAITNNLLGGPKYGPGSEPQWKASRTRYPAFYKALLEEPSRTKRSEILVTDQQSTRIQQYQDSSLDISCACEYLLREHMLTPVKTYMPHVQLAIE